MWTEGNGEVLLAGLIHKKVLKSRRRWRKRRRRGLVKEVRG